MNGLRQSARASASAFVALLAMLMVSTVALAAEAAPAPITMTTMMMAGTDQPMPCEDTGKAVCAPHCAVLCQALIVEPLTLTLPVVRSPQTYRYSETQLTPIKPEAEDPPPR